MYNKQQVNALSSYLAKKFLDGEAEGYEIVVTLMAMVKDKRIKESDVQPILMVVHQNNPVGVMRSLERANALLDEDLIDSIISDVKARR